MKNSRRILNRIFLLYLIICIFTPSLNVYAGGKLKAEDGTVNEESDMYKNAYAIYSFLKNCGWSDYAVAGAMGNINQESTYDPKESNGSHQGLCQWANAEAPESSGRRWLKLVDWCNANSLTDVNSIEAQLSFLIYEMNNTVNWQGYSYASYIAIDATTYGNDAEALASATDAFAYFVEGAKSTEPKDSNKASSMLMTTWNTEQNSSRTSIYIQERESRQMFANDAFAVFTGKEVRFYDTSAITGGENTSESASTEGMLTQQGGSLMGYSQLGITITDWYDSAIDLPTSDDLNLSDKSKLANWKADVEGSNSFSIIKWLRAVVAFLGIVISVYCIFIYIAYWFDRVNNFFDISLLSILTFGKLAISPDDTTSTFNPETKGLKVVVHRDIVFICLLGIVFGVILLSGKIYSFILWILSCVKKVIN